MQLFKTKKRKRKNTSKKPIKNIFNIKSSSYIDYSDMSEYFTDTEKALKEDIDRLEKYKKYTTWVQEFSKKIVVIAFGIYIISTLFSIYMIYVSFMQENIIGLDTLITETNQTFREVIGGYIIKAAVENSVKIAGNYFIGICDARLRILNSTLNKRYPEAAKNQEYQYYNSDFVDINGDADI